MSKIKLWSTRSLKLKKYVYIWADVVYFNIRSEEDRQCILVVMGVNEHGEKQETENLDSDDRILA